jgi:hypothetical protein
MRVLAFALVISFSLANLWLPAFHRKGAQQIEQDATAIRAVNCNAGQDLRRRLLPALPPGHAAQAFTEALDQTETGSGCAASAKPFLRKDR